MKRKTIVKLLAALAVLTALSLFTTGCLPLIIRDTVKEVFSQAASEEVKSGELRLQDDYYDYVNAEWLKTAQIGSGVPSIDSFAEASMQTTTDLLEILMELDDKAKAYEKGSDEQMLADFYHSSMDYANRDKDGLNPIMPFLYAIKNAKSIDGLMDALILMDNAGIGSFIMWGVSADAHDSRKNALYIDTGHIGLPQKEYYQDTDTQTQKIQSEYKKYLKALFANIPWYKSDAEKCAEAVYGFEKELSTSYWNAEEQREIEKLYNPTSLNELIATNKAFDIKKFFNGTGIGNASTYIVQCPQYFTKLNELFTADKLELLKKYATAKVLLQTDYFLTSDLEKLHIAFNNTVNGSDGSLLDIEKGYNNANDYLGELLSRIYVKDFFSEDTKKDVTKMVEMIIKTYEKRISKLDWMSDATKQKAIKKLETMKLKIGYPDKWNDYSTLDISTYEEGGSLYGNIINTYKLSCKKSLSEIDQPVDAKEWGMTAHTVNAYYNPSNNEIVFPAAMLQAPFYDKSAPLEANLGGIGSIIAHEISHAFDDEGAKFDENGNLNNWWTEQDLKVYQTKTQALVEQYDSVEVADGEYINGTLTLGENIADLGGMNCIVEAAKEYGSGDLDALFQAYANAWRSKCTPEYTSYALKADVHSPDKYRVNAILKNIDEFYETYNIKKSDGMYLSPKERVKIW